MTTTVLELHMEECVVVLGWVEEKNMAGERRWPESVSLSLSLSLFSVHCVYFLWVRGYWSREL